MNLLAFVLRGVALIAVFTGCCALTSQAQTLVLDMKASNYTVTSSGIVGGTWVDASASANTAYAKTYYLSPGLSTGATPNGSSAVNFNYNGYFKQAASAPEPLTLSSTLTGSSFTTAPSFTMEAVVKLTLGGTTIIYGGADSGDLTWSVKSDGTMSLSKAAVAVVGDSTSTLASNAWAVVAATYSGGSYSFYINGVLVGSGTSALTFATPTASYIGSTYGFSGVSTLQLAELKIYSGALSGSEIQEEYASLASTYGVPEPTTWSMALLGLAMMRFCGRLRTRKV